VRIVRGYNFTGIGTFGIFDGGGIVVVAVGGGGGGIVWNGCNDRGSVGGMYNSMIFFSVSCESMRSIEKLPAARRMADMADCDVWLPRLGT
jgi:predicted transcriptional regulator